MEIKTFGKITEIIDKEIDIAFPLSLHDLKKLLETEFPRLSSILYFIAIDHKMETDDDFMIENPKIIAVLPPFSGG